MNKGVTGGQWSRNFRSIWTGGAFHTLIFKKQIFNDTGFQVSFWHADILPSDSFNVLWGQFFGNWECSGQKIIVTLWSVYSDATNASLYSESPSSLTTALWKNN